MLPGDAEHGDALIVAQADAGDEPLLYTCAPSPPGTASFPHTGTGCAAGLKELSATFEVLRFFFLPRLAKVLLGGGWGLQPGWEIWDYS